MHMLPRTKPCIVQLSETTLKSRQHALGWINSSQSMPFSSQRQLVVSGRESRKTILTEHLTEEQLLQVTKNGNHQLWVHLEEGFIASFLALTFSLRVAGAPSRRFLPAGFGFAGQDIIVGLAVIGRLAQGFYFRI